MEFSLYTGATGGAAVWTEGHGSVSVTGGAFSVVLGSTGTASPLGPVFQGSDSVWLEVSVDVDGGLQPFTPRVQLTSAPYALSAAAEAVQYDNTASGLGASNVQDAVDEVDQRVDALEAAPAPPVTSVFGRTGDVAAAAGDYTAAQVDVTPAGNIASGNVQAALEELDTEKAAATHTHAGGDITSAVAEAATAASVPWTGVAGKPAGFADDIDNIDGGAAASAPWAGITGKPAGFADDVDDVDGGAAASAPWAGITGMPAGFADGVDNDSGGDITAVTAGTGLTGGAASGDANLAVDFAGTGAANTVARSDHNHAGVYSSASHTHIASDVLSGTFDIARLPVGTTSTTVAVGNHTHNVLHNPAGTQNVVVVDAENQVGVGTAAPDANLEINGTLKFTGDIPVANQTTGIVSKAPRAIHTTDPRGGCPGAWGANTAFWTVPFNLTRAAVVFIHGSIIVQTSPRADLQLVVDGTEVDRCLSYTPSVQWEDEHVFWSGVLAAGSHTVWMQSPQANVWGCGGGWGSLDVLIFE